MRDWVDVVQKLLAKAESLIQVNGEDDPEAAACMEQAEAIIAKRGLEDAIAAAMATGKSAEEARKITTYRIDIPKPFDVQFCTMATNVAEAMGLRAIALPGWRRGALRASGKRGGNIKTQHAEIFGTADELENFKMLYTSLRLQCASALAKRTVPAWCTGNKVAAWRRSYIWGWMASAVAKVREAWAVAEAEVAPEGTSKALVLRSHQQDIADAIKAAHPDMRRVTHTSSGGGFLAGHDDGKLANVGSRGGHVTGSGKAITS